MNYRWLWPMLVCPSLVEVACGQDPAAVTDKTATGGDGGGVGSTEEGSLGETDGETETATESHGSMGSGVGVGSAQATGYSSRGSFDTRSVDAGTGRTWTYGEYLRLTCEYYARCIPGYADFYGGAQGCIDATVGTLETPEFETPVPTPGAAWNFACIDALDTLACPEVAGHETTTEDGVKRLLGAVYDCIIEPYTGCIDNDDCWPGSACTGNGAECGQCVAREGTCESIFDCELGQTCDAGECITPRQLGDLCETALDCENRRCADNECVPVVPIGEACVEHSDCGTFAWCDEGWCAKPKAEGGRCSEDSYTSCQLDSVCVGGECQAADYTDVPLGGVCLGSSACAAGGRCNSEHSCEAGGNECNGDRHCAEGEYCNGVCLPLLDTGESCSDDRACKGQRCSGEPSVCVDVDACR
jgi:hypothetical protein